MFLAAFKGTKAKISEYFSPPIEYHIAEDLDSENALLPTDPSTINSVPNEKRAPAKPFIQGTFASASARRSVFVNVSIGLLVFSLGAISMIGFVRPQRTFVTDLDGSRWNYVGGNHAIEHCGKTPEEAKSRGCVWDLMSFSWTHPACYNKNESDAWLEKYGPWKWYPDRDSPESDAIPDEQLPYTPRVWTEQGYHIIHCLYIWKLIHLAGMGAHLVTDEGIGMAHTDHCVKLFEEPIHKRFTPYDQITTRVDLLFGRCVTMY